MEIIKLDEQLSNYGTLMLGAAIKSIYPTAKLGGSAVGEFGFYVDFECSTPVKTENLSKLEDEIKRLLKRAEITPSEKTKSETVKMFDKAGEPYLVELAGEIKGKISIVKIGNVALLGNVSGDAPRVVKLTQITGAYWRGDAKNKMLTRIYGQAFNSKDELAAFNAYREEILKRDHNKIGRELEYFTTVDIVGQGLPHMLPKGAKVLQILQRFVEDEEERRGYMYVKTPLFAKKELYELSGHWQHYKDGMFIIGDERLDDEVFALRPMTCPFNFFCYKAAMRSYRDLPYRIGETSTLFRNESSGEMHGLQRVRQFTLSEGHIMVRPDQVDMMIDECLELTRFFMNALGIAERATYRLSKWDEKNPKKYFGTKSDWNKSQDQLRAALVRAGVEFTEVDGDAAFYGPKIDVQLKNVHGKEDTAFTTQLDFCLAEKYDMTYVDDKGERVRPVIIHRSALGCYERTFAFLLEHYAGALPTWLAPVQAVVMGITNKQDDYVNEIYSALRASGIRVEKDVKSEKVGYKIREHTKKKTPYLIVVGDKEREENVVSVRTREGADLGVMNLEQFIGRVDFNTPAK